MEKIFTIKKEKTNQRLDKFLSLSLIGYSRAYLKKQIKEGRILVNGKIAKSSYILKSGDKIKTDLVSPPEISLEPDATIKLNIVFEDDNLIIVDKPAGLTIHPSSTQTSGTLVNALLAHYPPLKDVGDNKIRPGIVHRLDKETSGLMIVAKNNKSFALLKEQFRQRKIIKNYLALVCGHLKEPSGKIKTFILRSKSDPTKQKVAPWTEDAKGKEAITFYKTIKKFRGFTLIEAQPKTGRMHQIRVHLAWLGNPLAGDKKYGRQKKIILPNLTRHFLHAAYLKIRMPNGETKEFNSPLPQELKKIITALE